MQAPMGSLLALSQQVMLGLIPSMMPAVPIADSMDSVLLLPSLLFVAAVYKKQSQGIQVSNTVHDL